MVQVLLSNANTEITGLDLHNPDLHSRHGLEDFYFMFYLSLHWAQLKLSDLTITRGGTEKQRLLQHVVVTADI